MNLVTRSTIVSFLLCISVLTGIAQVPNGGFESWSGGNPDNWSTLNFLYHDISQSNIAHSGSSSAKAEIVSFGGNAAGIIFQAGPSAQGFAISGKPTSYSGYMQFSPDSGDQFYTSVIIYTGHSGSSGGTVIGTGLLTTSTSASGWTQYNVTINYTGSGDPNWAIINFLILPPTSGHLHVGTYFLVDDLVLNGTTGVNDNAGIPSQAFKLNDNYPNPFNPTTNISFNVPVESHVTLEVLNVLGQQVALLEDNNVAAGSYTRTWNGEAASGVYFYRLQAVGVNDSRDRFTEMKKMVLMR